MNCNDVKYFMPGAVIRTFFKGLNSYDQKHGKQDSGNIPKFIVFELFRMPQMFRKLWSLLST